MEKRTSISEKAIEQGTYKFLATLFSILSNADRLQILDLLHHNPPDSRSFSAIMFALSKNPNVIARHLEKLQDYDLVKKTPKGNYRITEAGKLALSATTKDILQIVGESLERAKSAGVLRQQPV